MNKSLERVFNPWSIAVVCASEIPGKTSERRKRSLLEGGYEGNVYLANQNRSELFERKIYPNLIEVDKEMASSVTGGAMRLLQDLIIPGKVSEYFFTTDYIDTPLKERRCEIL